MGTIALKEAPWNEPVIPERSFKVCTSQTLSKSASVHTQDYEPENEDGYVCANTEDTDWKTAYLNEHLSPLDIIKQAQSIAESFMNIGVTHIFGCNMQNLVKECMNWTSDEFEVIEE